MNFILIGGAPLSQTTHDFIRVCLGSIVVQGYSLTESTCTGTVMENCDLTSNTVGAPMTGKFIFFVCLFVFIFILFGVHSINKQTKPILNKLSTTYAGFKKVCTIFLIIKIFFTFQDSKSNQLIGQRAITRSQTNLTHGAKSFLEATQSQKVHYHKKSRYLVRESQGTYTVIGSFQ